MSDWTDHHTSRGNLTILKKMETVNIQWLSQWKASVIIMLLQIVQTDKIGYGILLFPATQAMYLNWLTTGHRGGHSLQLSLTLIIIVRNWNGLACFRFIPRPWSAARMRNLLHRLLDHRSILLPDIAHKVTSFSNYCFTALSNVTMTNCKCSMSSYINQISVKSHCICICTFTSPEMSISEWLQMTTF